MKRCVAQWFAFEASHFYALPHLSAEENARIFGKVARHHGHNYRVRICYHAHPETPPALWQKLEQQVRTHLDSQLDHRCLNLEHPYFQQHQPTTENLALYLWHDLQEQIEVPLEEVEVYESETLSASYRGEHRRKPDGRDQFLVYLTRVYTFSAAHRLYNPNLSEEENRQLFGKCANPYGHGHDYRLEVTVSGEPDPITGMVMNITDLDTIVRKEVLDLLDHRFLNEEVPPFDKEVPTSERIVQFIVERLRPHFQGGVRLARIRLYETQRSYFEWWGVGNGE